MNNLTDVVEHWLQGKVNEAVAGHSSRIAYLEGFVSSLSARLKKLEKSSPEAILDRRSQASDDDKRDAQRYRWLREQYWNGNVIAVVERPRDTVKIGTQTYSGVNLDVLIDKELQK